MNDAEKLDKLTVRKRHLEELIVSLKIDLSRATQNLKETNEKLKELEIKP